MCLFNFRVLADSKDVEVKYETSYNVDLNSISLDNSSDVLVIDDYSFEISTTMNNIEVVIIKASEDANSYAKGFTDSDDNYYLIVYQDGERIDNASINIKIDSATNVLNIYKNNGKLVEKSNEKIELNGNDFFFAVTSLIDIDSNDYVITDDGNVVDSVDDIEISSDSDIEIYNSKDVKVDNSSILGTNYRVIVTSGSETNTYVVVVKGDTTGDGKINLNDITRLYHYYKGIEEMEESYILAGDVASNKIINLNDVTKLYHYYKKIITSL